MTNQVLRRHALRLGRSIVSLNRQISYCSQKVKLFQMSETVQKSSQCAFQDLSRHMSTEPKFEAFNVQDTDDFKHRVLESSTPVIVDFHATWCGPCKLLGPRLESIIASSAGRVHLAKVDVDDNAEIAMDYKVQSVPTVLGIRNGKVLDQFIGLQDDDQIKTFVEKLVN